MGSEMCIRDRNLRKEDYKRVRSTINDLKKEYDLLIVGAGLSGSVIAEQASSRKGLSSLVIDKRNHIGGNCFDYVDEKGIRVSR